MALGAQEADILRLTLGQGLRPVAVGLGGGTLAALGLTRALASLLYGVEPGDPLVLGSAALLLAAVAGFAAYLPARRATRVDPGVVLSCE